MKRLWNVWLFKKNSKQGTFVANVEAVNEKQAIWRAGRLVKSKYHLKSSLAKSLRGGLK